MNTFAELERAHVLLVNKFEKEQAENKENEKKRKLEATHEAAKFRELKKLLEAAEKEKEKAILALRKLNENESDKNIMTVTGGDGDWDKIPGNWLK